jgi:hypothetical protein
MKCVHRSANAALQSGRMSNMIGEIRRATNPRQAEKMVGKRKHSEAPRMQASRRPEELPNKRHKRRLMPGGGLHRDCRRRATITRCWWPSRWSLAGDGQLL